MRWVSLATCDCVSLNRWYRYCRGTYRVLAEDMAGLVAVGLEAVAGDVFLDEHNAAWAVGMSNVDVDEVLRCHLVWWLESGGVSCDRMLLIAC